MRSQIRTRVQRTGVRWSIPMLALAIVVLAVACTVTITVATGLSPKAQYLQQYNDQYANAPHRVAGTPHAVPSSPPVHFEAGITNSHQGPYHSWQFLVSNSWRSPSAASDRIWIAVFAGVNSPGNGSPPSIPAVAVHKLTISADGTSSQDEELGFFAAPGANGPLTIISANGMVLTLQTDTGQIYHFDAANDRYL